MHKKEHYNNARIFLLWIRYWQKLLCERNSSKNINLRKNGHNFSCSSDNMEAEGKSSNEVIISPVSKK